MKTQTAKTCAWPGQDELMIAYHDKEWGTPVHDDKKHFEFLILDCFQAGLSWKTILHRRENFREAFANFDAEKIAKFDSKKIERLLKDEGIIRNRLKVEGTVKNAKAFLKLQKEHGTFDKYIWQFTGHKTIVNKHKSGKEIPEIYKYALFPTKQKEYELVYAGKMRKEDVLADTEEAKPVPLQIEKVFNGKKYPLYSKDWHNLLVFGDNLQILKTFYLSSKNLMQQFF